MCLFDARGKMTCCTVWKSSETGYSGIWIYSDARIGQLTDEIDLLNNYAWSLTSECPELGM